jgi:hypothetical protein
MEREPGSFGPVWFPMLVRRDAIEIVTLSLDPEFLIDAVRRQLSVLPVATQPAFKVGREGPAVKIWTEYPSPTSQASSQPVGQE